MKDRKLRSAMESHHEKRTRRPEELLSSIIFCFYFFDYAKVYEFCLSVSHFCVRFVGYIIMFCFPFNVLIVSWDRRQKFSNLSDGFEYIKCLLQLPKLLNLFVLPKGTLITMGNHNSIERFQKLK